jgi:hypothetical protein
MATQMLVEFRKSTAVAMGSSGKRKVEVGRDSARRRVSEAVQAELLAQGNAPLAGWPSNLRDAGDMLALIAQRDGFDAARAALIEVLAMVTARPFQNNPDEMQLCREIAAAWLDDVENTN